MKALSVKQPFASLIANGTKTIETRTWKTKFRGRILICSGKFQYPGSIYYPRGVALCTVQITDVRLFMPWDVIDAQCDFYDNAYAWVLKDLKIIERPFPVKGKLSLFNVDYEESSDGD